MKTRRCVVCGEEKKADEFYKACKSKCKPCYNKERNAYKNRCAAFFHRLAEGMGCAICGSPVCGKSCEWHHVNGSGEKDTYDNSVPFLAKQAGTYKSRLRRKALVEAGKCVVLCGTCHKSLHAHREGCNGLGKKQPCSCGWEEPENLPHGHQLLLDAALAAGLDKIEDFQRDIDALTMLAKGGTIEP